MTKARTASRREFLKVAASIALFPSIPRIAFGEPTPAKRQLSETGIEQPQTAPLDEMMRTFMSAQEAVGAALAVTRDGKLVYARGFGLADRDRARPVEPKSLFRIASISKPITAVAVLQLAERDKLTLDAKVVELLGLPAPKDSRWAQITIDHLLHHTGGWDRAKSFDPMFRSVLIARKEGTKPPAMPAEIIRYMTEQPLDFDPGERYAYSNFGYSLLGRVIERASGMTYEAYVRQQVLAPLGIQAMRLGATLPENRADGEVTYYDLKEETGRAVMGTLGEDVPLPYGTWCLEAMDAHGGWLASAVDLVRFARGLDDPAHCKILNRSSVKALFNRPEGLAGHKPDGEPKRQYYGCGWSIRQVGDRGVTAWHTGALDGTSTLLVHRHDRTSWAVLFNCRHGAEGKELSGAIDPLIHRAVSEIDPWPAMDQFETI